jgi:nitronate monooxygenase
MGIGLSNWRLANAVARLGQLGVVSGTGVHLVFARRLQQGDIGGHLRRILEKFPVPELAREVVERYFVPGGKANEKPFKPVPMFTAEPADQLAQLAVVANFAEIALAKENAKGPVGLNLLEKAQLGNLSALYGAMLAGVDYVLMGAGIPREIPGTLDKLAQHERASLKLEVSGAAPTDEHHVSIDPGALLGRLLPPLVRPRFLAIISSAVLAVTLAKKSNGEVNGFVIEGPTAGGHNAPPRGALQLDGLGQPIYGERDQVDLEPIRKLGLPFWLAGSYGVPGKLAEAQKLGAAGIQVGTAFAFCEESALAEELKQRVVTLAQRRELDVYTDHLASPTNFPFKVVRCPGTVSESAVYAARPRRCDVGVLRRPYKKPDGTIGYRCAAEPEKVYVAKGGTLADCERRMCICNGLVANLGLGQDEPPLLTAGELVNEITDFLPPGASSYSAKDVVERLLASA